MVVTAHYIDDSWNLHNRIIRFIYVTVPHTAKLLAKVLMECLVEWSLERKLSTLTLDNCTVNIAMMDQMKEKLRNASLLMKGELVHMKCSAHILNLIVQQGLGAIQGAIETIRESVVFWTGTPKRVEKFEEAKKGLSCASNKKLVLDCKTRWNSTYLMLTSAIVYKDVFSRLIHTEKNYKKEPSERDWLLAKVMCEKLKLFYHVTKMFSGTKYPTTNLFFSKICDIWLLLKECLKSSYDEIRIMASNMMDKFEQYWTSIHGILAIATVMDPRFKMKLIEYYFPKIYVGEYQNEVERIRMLCYDLVKEYKPNDGKKNLPDPLSNASGVGGDSDGCVDPLAGYDLFVSSTSKVDTFKSKLEFYLEEAVLPRSEEFDILAWWKTNGLKYPTLQQVARDVLAIPVSTVASESTFSTSGRHVTPCRNRLHPSMLEALVCTQDWLWDEKLDASQNEISHSTFFDDVEDDEAGVLTMSTSWHRSKEMANEYEERLGEQLKAAQAKHAEQLKAAEEKNAEKLRAVEEKIAKLGEELKQPKETLVKVTESKGRYKESSLLNYKEASKLQDELVISRKEIAELEERVNRSKGLTPVTWRGSRELHLTSFICSGKTTVRRTLTICQRV
ncbi:zinc finger BED domain-containing protein RICESLEEPER 2-like [Humulus lupulus]|uniref:zinc finger BED domain-containing protein RICESLEEPER 2-like n=1 Tax=Humulus lupulus TaxID=3486 RepID=UPI002B407326|nr:zinc finger BED domain-containing protein RICESLEEPER 2-like [Humulus lupulus]